MVASRSLLIPIRVEPRFVFFTVKRCMGSACLVRPSIPLRSRVVIGTSIKAGEGSGCHDNAFQRRYTDRCSCFVLRCDSPCLSLVGLPLSSIGLDATYCILFPSAPCLLRSVKSLVSRVVRLYIGEAGDLCPGNLFLLLVLGDAPGEHLPIQIRRGRQVRAGVKADPSLTYYSDVP